MVKIIIFDYDDTLVKSSEALYGADRKTAKSLGLKEPTKERYFSLWGKPHKEMIGALYPGVNFDDYIEAYKGFYDEEAIKLFEGAIEVVHSLHNKGFKLAILSAKQREFLDESLKRNEILKYFDYLHSAESSVYKKPNPHVFDDIISHFGVPPNEVLYVGDHLTDFEAARGAKLQFIAVTTGINTAKDFEEKGCKRIIDSLRELEKELRN